MTPMGFDFERQENRGGKRGESSIVMALNRRHCSSPPPRAFQFITTTVNLAPRFGKNAAREKFTINEASDETKEGTPGIECNRRNLWCPPREQVTPAAEGIGTSYGEILRANEYSRLLFISWPCVRSTGFVGPCKNGVMKYM